VRALAAGVLAAVHGGDSTTSVQVGPVGASSTTSDYKTCVDNVTSLTAQQPQYRDTRLWIGPFAFGDDANAGARAGATMRNIASVCGKPPP
jgi:hypothetical protein